jgi:hypothetical protein
LRSTKAIPTYSNRNSGRRVEVRLCWFSVKWRIWSAS